MVDSFKGILKKTINCKFLLQESTLLEKQSIEYFIKTNKSDSVRCI